MEIIFIVFQLLFLFLWLAFFAFFIGGFILWILMLIDCVQRSDNDFVNPSPNTKVIWVLVIILGGPIGAAVYYFVVKRAVK